MSLSLSMSSYYSPCLLFLGRARLIPRLSIHLCVALGRDHIDITKYWMLDDGSQLMMALIYIIDQAFPISNGS